MTSISRAKKGLKWTNSLLRRFLNLYQQHECLWNNNCELYKTSETAIRKIIIGLDVDLTEADIKNKIKSIRTIYRKELRLILKSKKSITGSADLYEPKLN